MMNDVITLCEIKGVQNENGYINDTVISEREVFAEKKSATRSEFYSAMAIGITVSAVFVVNALDYNGETRIKCADKSYKLERCYEAPNSEYIELTCSDMKEV